jgi:hypothetical protein
MQIETYQEVKTNENVQTLRKSRSSKISEWKKMDLVHATEPAVGMNVAIRKHGTIHQVDALVPGWPAGG